MREDMARLLVERPRKYGLDSKKLLRDVDGPSAQSMRAPYRIRKELNENLRPLWRWFDKQVGRPWSKIWSELRQRVDVRGATQLHIVEHARGHVETSARVLDGRVMIFDNGGKPREPRSGELYVHPKTGILMRDAGERESRKAGRSFVRLGSAAYGRRGDDWFRLELADLPDECVIDGPRSRAYKKVYDAFLGEWVSRIYYNEPSWRKDGNRIEYVRSSTDKYGGTCSMVYCVGVSPVPKARAKAMGLS